MEERGERSQVSQAEDISPPGNVFTNLAKLRCWRAKCSFPPSIGHVDQDFAPDQRAACSGFDSAGNVVIHAVMFVIAINEG